METKKTKRKEENKMLKKVMLAIMLVVFVSFSFGSINADAVSTSKWVQPYASGSAYQSTFDPHDILRDWYVVKTYLINQVTIGVVMGSPLINWNDWNPKTKDDPLPELPEGEISQLIFMIFMKTTNPMSGTESAILSSYGYMDKDDVRHLYRLDSEGHVYIPHTVQQD